MINGPEQANSKWWQTVDEEIIYGYAEDIEDGRGVTIGIYGATTGKDYNDADIIWKNYGQDYSNLPVNEIIEKVHAIANDQKWWKAQWDAYISTYWQPTLKLLKSKNYMKALTIGVLIDTAMNAGMGDDDSEHWGVDHLFTEASDGTNNEEDFVERFMELRLQFPTKNSGDMEEARRCLAKVVARSQVGYARRLEKLRLYPAVNCKNKCIQKRFLHQDKTIPDV